jgi:transcriptional regulator with XRE-family HTH domain
MDMDAFTKYQNTPQSQYLFFQSKTNIINQTQQEITKLSNIIEDCPTNCNILKLHRLKQGLSIKELSNISGISQDAIISIEKGTSSPNPNTLKKLCDVLNINIFEVIKSENNNINSILKYNRLIKGLLIKDLSKLSGVCPSEISDIERGNKKPTPKILKKLCDALNININDIIKPQANNIGEKIKIARISMGLSQREFAKLLGTYASTVSDWELGRHVPSEKWIEVLSKYI